MQTARSSNAAPIPLKGTTMMHDFALTATRAVFMDLPIVFDLFAALRGKLPSPCAGSRSIHATYFMWPTHTTTATMSSWTWYITENSGAPQKPGEAAFVPSSSAEDAGWLMSYVYDAARDRSDFVALDANDIAAGPVATVALPVRVPLGFHGNWIDAALPLGGI
jgi:carotenoid cleavage dioxygenase-like enzyme